MREFVKNTDPGFWEQDLPWCNCGGLAFNIKTWYSPEWKYHEVLPPEFFDIDEYAEHLWLEGYETWEIANQIQGIYLEGILEDFGDKVRVLNDDGGWDSDEELIAFRVRSGYYDGDYTADVDFHFKVLRDGIWIEKNGSNDVHTCDEDEWEYFEEDNSMYYDSDTIYLAHKI